MTMRFGIHRIHIVTTSSHSHCHVELRMRMRLLIENEQANWSFRVDNQTENEKAAIVTNWANLSLDGCIFLNVGKGASCQH